MAGSTADERRRRRRRRGNSARKVRSTPKSLTGDGGRLRNITC